MKKLLAALLTAVISWPALASADEVDGAPVYVPGESAPAMDQRDPNEFKVFWRNGLRMETRDKRFQFRIGGRLQADITGFTNNDTIEDSVGTINDGFEMRRARLHIAGQMWDRFIFRFGYDFAGGGGKPRFGNNSPNFADVYGGVIGIPFLGTLRVGHFKEPFSLEELASSNDITFLERGLSNALVPARNSGLAFNNNFAGDRGTLACGVFWESDDLGDSVGDNVNVSARLTGLPLVLADDKFMHFGFNYSRRDPNGGFYQVVARPEANMAPFFVNSGSKADPIFTSPGSTQVFGTAPPSSRVLLPYAPADTVDVFGPEVAFVVGPFSLQAEYTQAIAGFPKTFSDGTGDLPAGVITGDTTFSGYYVNLSYFVTGESRPYNRNLAIFERIIPKRNFLDDGGWGAWEVAGRYSSLDGTDSGVKGGFARNGTVGVNWYLNPNSRIMFNYIYNTLAKRIDFNGTEVIHSFQLRFQVNV